MAGFWDFFTGTKGKYNQKSTLTPEQRGLHSQLIGAGTGQGGGGAFGQAADYYRDLLDPNSQTAQQMFAPEMRRFNEDIIPGLSEQFAGMGSGALSSSGFRNAAVNAGTDLSERLGAIRANLRQQGAQGLMNIGQAGLSPVTENIYQQRQPGLLQTAAQGIGQGFGMMGGQFGGNWMNQRFGKSSPYGNQQPQGYGQPATGMRY